MTGPGEAVVVRLPERFEAFYEREYHRVVGFAYALTGSWEAAEDATQEEFLRALRDWERIGRYDQPGAWVFYLEDWPTAEIARFLGCSATTVRGRRAAQAVVKAAERLGPAPELGGIRRRKRRRAAIRAGLAGLALLLAAAVLWPRLTPPGQPGSIRPGPVLSGVPGMDRRVRDAIPTGQTTHTDLAVGPDAVWVLNRNRLPGQDLLVRVDPATDRVVASVDLRSDRPADVQPGLVAADSTVVAARGRTSLYLLDPAANRAQAPVPLPGPGGLGVGAGPSG
jgi:hypothetical protein